MVAIHWISVISLVQKYYYDFKYLSERLLTPYFESHSREFSEIGNHTSLKFVLEVLFSGSPLSSQLCILWLVLNNKQTMFKSIWLRDKKNVCLHQSIPRSFVWKYDDADVGTLEVTLCTTNLRYHCWYH